MDRRTRRATWGATTAERSAVLPGDELLSQPADQTTRAITIDAPAPVVWPWLVQIGADRAGFYSYDWLENLVGLHIHSADRIVDRWQHLEVGDLVYGDRRRHGGWVVVLLAPAEALVLQVADVARRRPVRRDEGVGWEFQWTFALVPVDERTTRLLVRERVAFGRRLTRWLMTPAGLVSFVMTRRMMFGIAERAERSAATTETDRAA